MFIDISFLIFNNLVHDFPELLHFFGMPVDLIVIVDVNKAIEVCDFVSELLKFNELKLQQSLFIQ